MMMLGSPGSGEIPRVTTFETGLANHYRRAEDGSGWEPADERFVAVRLKDKDKGVFVFTACSHAGVVNVLTHPGTPSRVKRFTASWEVSTPTRLDARIPPTTGSDSFPARERRYV
jgi:metal-dependent hydrolase (beta-lactamase superfamily II)